MKKLFYGLFVVSYSPFQANDYVQISGLHSQSEVMKQLLDIIHPHSSETGIMYYRSKGTLASKRSSIDAVQ